MIKRPKAKGRRAEVLWASMLVDSGLDPKARRMVLSGSILGLEGDTWTKLPFMFEVKNQEKVRLWEFWNQTVSQVPMGSGKKPTLVIFANHKQPLVVMDANDWITLTTYAMKGGYEDN